MNLMPNSGARLICLTVLTALVLSAVGYFPTRNLAGAAGVVAMLVGVAIALLSSLAGLAPALLSLRGSALDRHKGLMTGMGIRFLTVLAMTVAAALSGFLNQKVVVVWVAISYMTLLMVDTPATIYLIRRMEKTAE
jgi:uncharacterized membrane protein required for colicin V production